MSNLTAQWQQHIVPTGYVYKQRIQGFFFFFFPVDKNTVTHGFCIVMEINLQRNIIYSESNTFFWTEKRNLQENSKLMFILHYGTSFMLLTGEVLFFICYYKITEILWKHGIIALLVNAQLGYVQSKGQFRTDPLRLIHPWANHSNVPEQEPTNITTA